MNLLAKQGAIAYKKPSGANLRLEVEMSAIKGQKRPAGAESDDGGGRHTQAAARHRAVIAYEVPFCRRAWRFPNTQFERHSTFHSHYPVKHGSQQSACVHVCSTTGVWGIVQQVCGDDDCVQWRSPKNSCACRRD